MNWSLLRKMRWFKPPFSTANGVAGLLLAVAMIVAAVLLIYPPQPTQREGVAPRLADTLAQDVDRTVEQLDLILGTVMAGQETPASPSLTPEQRNTLLFQRTPRDRYIAFLEVLNPDGAVLAQLNPDEPASNWAKQDYFEALRRSPTKELYVGKPFSIDSEDNAGFTISRRITAQDGRFAGVVVIGVRLALFRDLLSRHGFDPTDAVTLLRDDGLVLMRLPFDLREIGHRLGPSAPFYAFTRGLVPRFTTGNPTDDLGQLYAFRRVGRLPLVVSIATPIAKDSGSPPPWWLAGTACAFGVAFTLALQARRQKGIRRSYIRTEAAGQAPRMRPIDLPRLAKACLAVVEPSARARGLETRITVALGTPTQFVTDDVHLQQILINLLTNAVKYTPRGLVELQLSGDQKHLTIEVADTGIGIPEGRRHLLFKEYQRFGTERTSIEGTGLGLAIAYRLARRMRGHMGHRDNPGGGSVFWLELPAGATDETQGAADAQAIVQPDLAAMATDPDSMAPFTDCPSPGSVEPLLDCLALRIEALLRKLEDPVGIVSSEALADQAHDLIGSGGSLGFTGLASAASRFEASIAKGRSNATEFRREALAALSELRQRRSLDAILSN